MSLRMQQQTVLLPGRIAHPHAKGLQAMSEVLDGHPEMLAWIEEDLLKGLSAPVLGRRGMCAEHTIRALLVKQMEGCSYQALSFLLADSVSYRRFCRVGLADRAPKASTLQQNIGCNSGTDDSWGSTPVS